MSNIFETGVFISIISFSIVLIVILRKFIEIGLFGKNEIVKKNSAEKESFSIEKGKHLIINLPKLNYKKLFAEKKSVKEVKIETPKIEINLEEKLTEAKKWNKEL
ncbi:MAG: hypothetical protein Fur0024_2300 [Patescibacteria group bacterium]